MMRKISYSVSSVFTGNNQQLFPGKQKGIKGEAEDRKSEKDRGPGEHQRICFYSKNSFAPGRKIG